MKGSAVLAAGLMLLANGAFANGSFKAALAQPGAVYDAGMDLSGNGVNDNANVPWCTSSAVTIGQGKCVGGASDGDLCMLNSSDPGGGAAVGNCTGNGGVCTPLYDGITTADAERGRCSNALTTRCLADLDCGAGTCISLRPDSKKSKCQVSGTSVKGTFALRDVNKDKTFEPPLADTVPGGTCTSDASMCTKDTDCAGGFCTNGDEFWMQVQAQIGVNQDNTPPCAPDCVAAARLCLGGICLTGGPLSCTDSAECDLACMIGLCTGGSDAGAPCDAAGGVLLSDCNGGGCAAAFAPAPAGTGDEISIVVPDTAAGDISAVVYCPVAASFSIPGELKKGKVSFKSDLLKAFPIGIDPSIPVTSIQCNVHDQPSAEELIQDLVLGAVVLGSEPGMCHKEPCPATLVVSDLAGVNTPVSPIIASTGETAGNTVKCDAVGDKCCTGSVCVAPLTCNTTSGLCQ
jgi:hypothetical protein